ncbi:helix-turn-helix domain-containing protein [Caldalkalibacillus mannanilyticus]|uniref:helix-turn-helix domain-containing protein n=1 Tax=Caldalkalibacillus mannanilyticus TaxID=1418 RepID=UPI00046A5F63|nr:helix-turn-helix transcriptional regulator [Caldalkalibacillus mannanilyticus]
MIGGASLLKLQAKLHRTLRSEIERNIKERGYSISKTAELSGMNPGNLSGILNGNPPRAITIRQLDALAKVFGYEQGWLYELYPEECISEGKVSRPRLIPYLVRCAEIGRQDCIEIVVSHLLENPKNLVILYSVAEQLFESGKKREALPFYEVIIDNEKDSYSDQFVISHYRVFRIKLGENLEKNWQAAVSFAPYCQRLPEDYQLDALYQLTRVFYSIRKWDHLGEFADKLQELATTVYCEQLRQKKKEKRVPLLRIEHPLVSYYGKGHLLKGVALARKERYEEAIKCVEKYIDLSWFEILDDLGKQEVEKFRYWGEGNIYGLNLLMGKIEILEEYVEFLTRHPKEILPGLLGIVEAANKHDFNVDWVLNSFSENIKQFEENRTVVNMSQQNYFRNQLAIYLFRRGKLTEGINETIRCLDLSEKTKEYMNFKKCAEYLLESIDKKTE